MKIKAWIQSQPSLEKVIFAQRQAETASVVLLKSVLDFWGKNWRGLNVKTQTSSLIDLREEEEEKNRNG